MIEFRCEHCSRKLRATQLQAGKKRRCPHCKGWIVVPSGDQPAPAKEDSQWTAVPGRPAGILYNEALLDIRSGTDSVEDDAATPKTAGVEKPSAEDPQEQRRKDRELLMSLGMSPLPEYSGERKLPWLIDIFLYPISTSGLSFLGIIVGIQVVMHLVQWVLGPFGSALALPFAVVNWLVGTYVVWYWAECVHDSARGGTRAPDTLNIALSPREIIDRLLYLAAVTIVFASPPGFYRMFTDRTDAIFWVLVAWGVVLCPMGLLAMVMHDSTDALNPLFLVGSIFRTFFQYVGLLIVFGAFAGLFWLADRMARGGILGAPLQAIGTVIVPYLWFVIAHLLGRFHWRNRDRLDWGM